MRGTGGASMNLAAASQLKQPPPSLFLPLLQGSRISCLMKTLELNDHTGRKTSFSPQVALPQGSQPLVNKLGPDHFITDSFKNMRVTQEDPNHCRIGFQIIPCPHTHQSIPHCPWIHPNISGSPKFLIYLFSVKSIFPISKGFMP